MSPAKRRASRSEAEGTPAVDGRSDGRPEASIILVVGPSGPGPDAAGEAVREHTPTPHEVIVVVRGSDDLPPEAAGGVRFIQVPEDVPFAAAANQGATRATGGALCFLDAAALVTDGWLPPLLAAITPTTVGAPSVALAVPAAVSPDKCILEAGAVLHRDGSVGPLGAGAPAGSVDHGFPRTGEVGSSFCVCVRRSAFIAAGGFDPQAENLVVASVDLSHLLRTTGHGSLYQPASRVSVTADPALTGTPVAVSAGSALLAGRWAPGVPSGRPGGGTLSAHQPARRDADAAYRVLVVAPVVPRANGPVGERRVVQLLSDLAALCPGARLTLVAVDGFDAARRSRHLLAEGVEVASGPEDWRHWFEDRLVLFSHVVLTDIESTVALDAHVRDTQPQAERVLYLPSLPFRDVATMEPSVTSPLEIDGFRLEADLLREGLARQAQGFDAVWCASRRDRQWFTAAVPGAATAVLPLAARPTDEAGFEERSGFVVLGGAGADLVAGHEHAAFHAVTHVLPSLVARDPHAFLRIVVDEPSPLLQQLRSPHVELVSGGDDPGRWFRRARVCLASYPHGAGATDALALAVDTATPFVTSQAALDEADLAPVGAVVAGDAGSVALRAGRLHDDPARWHEVHDHLARVAEGHRSATTARQALARAVADVGIVSDRRASSPVTAPVPSDARDSTTPSLGRVPVVGTATPPCPDDLFLHPDEQYRRWRRRFGPLPQRLAGMEEQLRALTHRPTVSVVMPVYNTDATVLDAAIQSVRTQLYGNWELCVADDGTTRAATLAVLERHLDEEPRLRIVHLPETQGIVGASNAALSSATGEFVALLDHDDELKPHALAEVALRLDREPGLDLIYTDEDKLDADGHLVEPFFKPGWSPDHLMSRNYICHLLVVRRTLMEKLGGFRAGYDGSQDYDLVLRATELTDRIAHIPEPLYTWRKVEGSTAAVADAKPYAIEAAKRALTDASVRRGTPAEVVDGLHPTTYRVHYALRGRPKVSIVIPTRDRVGMLRGCVDSILERSTYTNFELVVVDNQSVGPETLAYLATFPGRVVRYPHRFNYSRIMNMGCARAEGDMLLLLNNDTEVHTPDWIEALLEHAQRPDVGVVGPRLLYPSGRPQHEGIITRFAGGIAGNVDHGGFWGLGDIVRNCTAVTGACMMLRPSVYWAVGGHDENLRIAFNDVDLCLRINQAGYDVVYTPYAELEHVEGGTRGVHPHPEDNDAFNARWATEECVDRFYSPNLCRRWPFRIRN
ncbi:MAG: glycosyltransferase [Acidimicrobiales bacterium]